MRLYTAALQIDLGLSLPIMESAGNAQATRLWAEFETRPPGVAIVPLDR